MTTTTLLSDSYPGLKKDYFNQLKEVCDSENEDFKSHFAYFLTASVEFYLFASRHVSSDSQRRIFETMTLTPKALIAFDGEIEHYDGQNFLMFDPDNPEECVCTTGKGKNISITQDS